MFPLVPPVNEQVKNEDHFASLMQMIIVILLEICAQMSEERFGK